MNDSMPPRPTILLVDDDKHMRRLLVARLEALGAELLVAGNAQEALSLLGRTRPALVLSDAVMPDLDGFELCRRIKADPEFQDLPFVLITSLNRDVQERCREAGVDDHLAKQEEDVVLRIRLRHLLEGRYPDPQPRFGAAVLFASPAPSLRGMLAAQLAPLELRVEAVATLEEVPPALARERFKGLVVDLALPGCADLLARLRQAANPIPVLALYTKGREDDLLPLEARLQDCLAKPLAAKPCQHRISLLVRMSE